MVRTLFFTDIHGNYRGLMQALERAKYDPATDKLICGGDIVDGGPDSVKCVQFVYNNVDDYLLGNHDNWFFNWIHRNGTHEKDGAPEWIKQGGLATVRDVQKVENHTEFYHIARQLSHRAQLYIIRNNVFFSHAGFNPRFAYDEQPVNEEYYWNRSLAKTAFRLNKYGAEKAAKFVDSSEELVFCFMANTKLFDRIFIGHSQVTLVDKDASLKSPAIWGNVINCDTGAGHKGYVTVTDVDSLETWRSNNVFNLYGYRFGEKHEYGGLW